MSTQDSTAAIIRMDNVTRVFDTPTGPFTALKGVSVQAYRGEFIAIVGKSGSGKSTLMNVLTGIDRPTSGSIIVAEREIQHLSQKQLAMWRGRTIGVVFQFFQLLPTLTVAENVMLPMDLCRTFPPRERRERAEALLTLVGITGQADKLPSSLSGGQQQRAAIARALANDPPILIADEPTGNLDSATADQILELFAQLAVKNKTVLMVTHERDVHRYVTRTITLKDGQLAEVVHA